MNYQEARESRCPKCDSPDFASSSGEPVEVSGWYGDVRFIWSDEGGFHHVAAQQARCGQCDYSTYLE